MPVPPQRILQDVDTFIEKTASVTHFMFKPHAPENKALSNLAASLTHRLEAIEILPAGVILQVKNR
ncbi:MAG: hypothetical protein Q9M16_04905 [Mariprofundus sp.]|nr:hypothetical protein [Mariprofundus sp.]